MNLIWRTQIPIYKALNDSILLSSFFITLIFKHDFFHINIECLHILVALKILLDLIFYITLNLYVLTIYVICCNVTSTAEMLSKLGWKCFEIFWIVFHTFDDWKNFLSTTFEFENMNLSICFLNLFGLLDFFFSISFFLFILFNYFHGFAIEIFVKLRIIFL